MLGNHPDDHAVMRLFLAAHPELTETHLRAVKDAGLAWPNWIRLLSTYYGELGPNLFPAIQDVFKLIAQEKASSTHPVILMEDLADIAPAGVPPEVMLCLATEIAAAIGPDVVVPKAVTEEMREEHGGGGRGSDGGGEPGHGKKWKKKNALHELHNESEAHSAPIEPGDNPSAGASPTSDQIRATDSFGLATTTENKSGFEDGI